MAPDGDRVEQRRDEKERERATDREPTRRDLASRGDQNTARDDDRDEEQHLVGRPAVDGAGARESEPDREPGVAARFEARGEHDADADHRDGEHATRRAEELAESGEEHGRATGAAR